MAKDDYDTIVYKILLYLYACLKRKIVFDRTTFFKAIDKDAICDEYLADILYFRLQRFMNKTGCNQKRGF